MNSADKGQALRDQAMDWMLRIEAAPGDKALRAELDAWLAQGEDHRRAYRTMGHVWGRLGELPADAVAGTASVAAADTRATEADVVPIAQHRRFRPFAIATALALAACVALVLYPVVRVRLLADHVTSVAELRDVGLEDGSVVHLDAGSAIAVGYTAGRRAVTLLSGQAFFEVVRNAARPFVVTAGEVTITVTGTAFDVRSWAEGVSVAVQSGSVEVSIDGGRHVASALKSGDRVVVSRTGNRIARGQVAPDEVASWRERRLIVHDATLAEVVEQLDRHYRGVVVLRDEALAQSVLSGVFDLGRPVEALNAVVQAQGGKLTQITPYLMVVSAR